MSILIKGAKMPRDCPMCPLSHWNRWDEFTGCEVVNGKRFAVIIDEGYAQSNTRPSWCPLVEIPPHGRLIDAGEVMKSIKEDYCDSCEYKPTTCHDCHIGDVLFIIANAPTVIESEEE